MEILENILSSDGQMSVTQLVAPVLPDLQPTRGIISQQAIGLIKHFESAHDGDKTKPGLQPQMDPIGIWTVGYGHVLTIGNRVLQGEKDRAAAYGHGLANLSETEAETLLLSDLEQRYLPAVRKLITRRLNADQLGALCSFCYNCGTHYKNKAGKLVPYAIWGNVNAGMSGKALWDYWRASVTKAGRAVQPGLVRRRKAEAYLFLKGENNFYPKDNWEG